MQATRYVYQAQLEWKTKSAPKRSPRRRMRELWAERDVLQSAINGRKA